MQFKYNALDVFYLYHKLHSFVVLHNNIILDVQV